ncbi:ClpX C4-type zinc finger protein [Burkholderia vietnamiensis]|uniref:ClpX C4-type zinc finger protein n=1 Tax=Burkholderia vietnamiensis TaxID=60552 RepID=UPI0009BE8A1E|nr:ClpX C4-type zinc finger protein [Burkholderia vietnamiensis]
MSKKWTCDFCNRTEDEVADIVVTPSEVAICDECVATCAEIIAEASRPSDVKVKVTINNVGQPIAAPAKEDADPIPSSRPTREPNPLRITDRQIEIMTAAICEVICGAGHVTAENAADAAPALIKAIVVQVSRLNDAITDADSAATARASSKSRGCRCQHSDHREDPSEA